MGSTKIEYLDTTWNFLTGCNNWKDPAICGGGGSEFKCWAKSMADRFGRDFTPRYNRDAFVARLPKVASRIGVCFTGDLFQDSVDPEMNVGVQNGEPVSLRKIALGRIENHPEHQFFFLTKRPQNLYKWGRFPDNAWVGVSVTNGHQFTKAVMILGGVQAAHKWFSIEPLINWELTYPGAVAFQLRHFGINWVVVGGLSNKSPSQQPPVQWVKEIVLAAEEVCIPVWIKNNLHLNVSGADKWALSPELGHGQLWRQELPQFHVKAAT